MMGFVLKILFCSEIDGFTGFDSKTDRFPCDSCVMLDTNAGVVAKLTENSVDGELFLSTANCNI